MAFLEVKECKHIAVYLILPVGLALAYHGCGTFSTDHVVIPQLIVQL